jgi:hypothetical protein
LKRAISAKISQLIAYKKKRRNKVKSVKKAVTITKMDKAVKNLQEKGRKYNNTNSVSNLKRNKTHSKSSAASYAFVKTRNYGPGTMKRLT